MFLGLSYILICTIYGLVRIICTWKFPSNKCKIIMYLFQHFHWRSKSWFEYNRDNFCDPMDCSLPGSSVHGILQARVLEWVAISFSRGSSRPRDQTQVSRIAGRFFTLWATREAQIEAIVSLKGWRQKILQKLKEKLLKAMTAFFVIFWAVIYEISFHFESSLIFYHFSLRYSMHEYCRQIDPQNESIRWHL